ncbi:siroheme decarboxylase subunit beta [Candidatus Venteria ishoeyi]|uniref:siroheme decarboxylase n=1 Tax=Candidatus Venteria ishoeyi TaxID=1899563 RepID=A0A1H6FEA9_9GAMM|nr:hypothetical protein [Candidatus Venteria ishoeyi]SEH07983.1 Uncharacterised protein [Candidatus Venteria ishoeyi]
MDTLSKNIIRHLQIDFPLCSRPFQQAASRLGITEDILLTQLRDLLDNKILSRFGPLYHAERLGGGLTLAALRAAEQEFDAVADYVNSLPEVAHNYAREHELNMWFVIATEKPEDIARVINKIHLHTGLPVYDFPKQKEYYLGLKLNPDGQAAESFAVNTLKKNQTSASLESFDRLLIQATQAGLALCAQPYQEVANQIGSDENSVIQRLQTMLEQGMIRRIGVVPNHYKLGYCSNGMTVWDVKDDVVDALGQQVGQLDFVSHCYRRPRHLPKWPYNLFAMVHARSHEEIQQQIEKIKTLLGAHNQQHDVLFSRKILKKTGLRFS